MPTLLLVHFAVTLALVGLIWTIQLVHYPSFAFVSETRFAAFHAFHGRQITWLVAPLMVVEAGTALWLAVAMASEPWLWVGLGLVGVIWASTMGVQVPIHRRLSETRSEADCARLVRTNWIRTVAWTARGVILLGVIG
ncbi:MAG: hypothetical protein ACI9MR_000866 [Myxococcota bacterium]|jgi:hypothetical protein